MKQNDELPSWVYKCNIIDHNKTARQLPERFGLVSGESTGDLL
jgi:hypothetical protein